MPIVETSIVYEFPTDERNKRYLISKHKAKGRQWVSTSIHDGHARMKFAIVRHKKEKPQPKPIDWNSDEPYEQVLKQVRTVNRGGQRLIAYAGSGEGKGEWDA